MPWVSSVGAEEMVGRPEHPPGAEGWPGTKPGGPRGGICKDWSLVKPGGGGWLLRTIMTERERGIGQVWAGLSSEPGQAHCTGGVWTGRSVSL